MARNGPQTRTRRPVPWGLVGMVALVAAVEVGVHRLGDDLASWTSAQFAFAERGTRAEAPGCDFLCFGDSVVCNGIAPAVVSEHSGFRAYNLATIGNPPAASYVLLRRALERGARPKSILVDFKWGIVRETHRPDLQAFAEIAGLRDALELAWVAGDPEYLARFALAKLLPTVRARVAIRAGIGAALRGLDPSNRTSIALLRRNWAANRGAQIMAPNPAAWSVAAFPDPPGKHPEDWSGNPINRAIIERFFRLAESRGIRVYWYLNPVHPSNQSRRDRLGVDARWTEFVRSVPRPPNVVVLDARRFGLDGTHFTDAAHPDRRGALALSAALGDWLREQGDSIPAGGWVTLPPAAVRVADQDRVEDFGQSALKAAEDSRLR